MADWLKSILAVVAVAWSFALVFSLLVVGAHYLSAPWDLVCSIFVIATGTGVAAGLCAYWGGCFDA